ncbi:AtpZ/AtpI family protein [Elusimicrobiota bacterium]
MDLRKIAGKEAQGLAMASAVGITIVVSSAIGVFLGLTFDKYFNTKPVGFLIFFVLGTASGFYAALKDVIKASKKQGEKNKK